MRAQVPARTRRFSAIIDLVANTIGVLKRSAREDEFEEAIAKRCSSKVMTSAMTRISALFPTDAGGTAKKMPFF
jgi:hypothetical protein